MTELLLVLLTMFLLAITALVGISYGVARWWKLRLKRLIAKVNQTQGTNFVVEPATTLGSWTGKALLFDPKTKKLMLYLNGRYTLHDYNYIRGWNLHWIEKTLPSGGIHFRNVHFVLETSDLNRPVQHIPVISKSMGEEWNQRLRLLLNG